MLYRLFTVAFLAAASVLPAAAASPPYLQEPYDVLPLANGHLVVTDLPQGKVLDLDPAHHTGRVLAVLREARLLERLPDGRLLVSARARVYALDPRTRRLTPYATFRNYVLGITLGPDGWLYGSENVPGSEETTVVRIRSGVREVLVSGLRGVHELLLTHDGVILPEAYAGRVLRLDPETRTVTVLATGMKNPGSALVAAGGGYFVAEFFGNRISRLWPDGHVTKVADVFKPGAIAYDSRHRIVGASGDGQIFRIVRGRAVTIYP